MANINEVMESMHNQNAKIGATLTALDGHMAAIFAQLNTMMRADVRGGVDVGFQVGLGVTDPDNMTVGQVMFRVKPEDGMIYGLISFNDDSATRYARFYEGSAAPRVGSTPMKFPIGLPTGSGAVMFGGIGIPFHHGIWVAGTAGPTDSTGDIASPAASKVMVVIFYK